VAPSLQRTPRTLRRRRRNIEIPHRRHLRTLERRTHTLLPRCRRKRAPKGGRTTQRRVRGDLFVRPTGKIVHLFKLVLLFEKQILHFFKMLFEHRVERVLGRFDQVAQFAAEFALAGGVPDVVRVLDEDFGVLGREALACHIVEWRQMEMDLRHGTSLRWCRLLRALSTGLWSLLRSRSGTRRCCRILCIALQNI
jgi:hypothetical protein